MRAKVTPLIQNIASKTLKRGQAWQGEVIFENSHFMTIAREDAKGNFVRNESVNKSDIYPCNSYFANDYLVEVVLND